MNVRARSLNKMRKISKNDILYILALIQTDNYFLIKISQYDTNFDIRQISFLRTKYQNIKISIS